MYYAHVGGSHFQCLDHINLNAMNLPCGPYYRGLRSSLRSSSGLSSSRPGSRSSSGGALTMTMTGSNAINGSIIRVGESADGLPVKADTRTANEQQGDGDLSVPRGGEGLVHGSSTTLKITPLVGPRHWPAGRRQMASRRRKLVVVRTPAAPMTDGDVLNSDSDSAYPEQHTTLPVLKQQQRSTDSRGGSETSPLQLMARTGSRDFCSGGGGGSGGGSGAGSLSCFGTRSLGRGDVLSKVYLASANVERKGETLLGHLSEAHFDVLCKTPVRCHACASSPFTLLSPPLPLLSGNDLVASRRSKPYFGRAISSELPQQGTAATASTRASVGSF